MKYFLPSGRPLRLLSFASALLFALFAATTYGSTEDANLCGISTAWANSDGQYIFNNNAWGNDGSGAQCTHVLDDGESFEVIWKWAAHATETHAFPNVQLNTLLFPLLMSDLESLNLQASWTMLPVDSATRANVVFDMFVDPEKSVASSTTSTVDSKYEIMIWIGAYGDPWPLGTDVDPWGAFNSSLPHLEISGIKFTLFSGDNDAGQTVHSWLAHSNVSDFTADVTPLLTYLTDHALIESDAYMGILQFGSETFHSTANVTFDVTSFDLNVTSTNASANAAAANAVHPSSTGSSSSSSASGSSSSSDSSSTSTISLLPFWFWEIAAAGCIFAML